MSSLKVHTIQSVVTSAALYPLIGENVVPFGLAVIFIDVDHLEAYFRDTKSLDLRGVFAYSKLLEINLDKRFLVYNMFHTVEFFALIFALSAFFPKLFYVFAGMVFHITFDIFHLIRLGKPFARAFSIIEYIYRSRNGNYLTSIKELLPIENLNTSCITNLNTWLRRWGLEKYRSA